jgi:hypothetical protein
MLYHISYYDAVDERVPNRKVLLAVYAGVWLLPK